MVAQFTYAHCNLTDEVDNDQMEDDVGKYEVGKSTFHTDTSEFDFIQRVDL